MNRQTAAGAPDAPHPAPPDADRVIPVRQVRPRFGAVPDRLWFGGNRFRTAFFNAYLMLLCEESEFVSIVRKYLPALPDGTLRQQLKSWLGQEASHGVQHRKACLCLDRMRLRYRAYQRIVSFITFRMLFPILSKRFRISLVAGLEHFNTMIGEMCLSRPDYFANVDPELALLLRWHFAEEIEHRAVMHDVAEKTGVGYLVRILAGIVAFILYTGILFVTACWFAMQSLDLLRPSSYGQMARFLLVDERFVQFSLSYLRAYLAPRFHPLQRASDRFSEPVFQGLAPGQLRNRS